MGVTFTPFYLIVSAITILAVYIAVKSFNKKKYYISAIIAVIIISLWVFSPVKLTTNTKEYNASSDHLTALGHDTKLRELPDRVVVKRKSYDDFLESETKKIKSK